MAFSSFSAAFTVGCNICDHLADLCVGYCRNSPTILMLPWLIRRLLRQYTGYVGMDMKQWVLSLRGGSVEITAHVRFALVHKSDHPFGDKIHISGYISIVKYDDAIFAGGFCQLRHHRPKPITFNLPHFVVRVWLV